MSTLHIAVKNRLAHPWGNPTSYNSPVVLGSKSTCFVPLLTELCWILLGADGLEFAENPKDIKRALSSGRDVTLVPSGFSTIGTGGVVDWSKRGRFFKMIFEASREGEGRSIVIQPVSVTY